MIQRVGGSIMKQNGQFVAQMHLAALIHCMHQALSQELVIVTRQKQTCENVITANCGPVSDAHLAFSWWGFNGCQSPPLPPAWISWYKGNQWVPLRNKIQLVIYELFLCVFQSCRLVVLIIKPRLGIKKEKYIIKENVMGEYCLGVYAPRIQDH